MTVEFSDVEGEGMIDVYKMGATEGELRELMDSIKKYYCKELMQTLNPNYLNILGTVDKFYQPQVSSAHGMGYYLSFSPYGVEDRYKHIYNDNEGWKKEYEERGFPTETIGLKTHRGFFRVFKTIDPIISLTQDLGFESIRVWTHG